MLDRGVLFDMESRLITSKIWEVTCEDICMQLDRDVCDSAWEIIEEAVWDRAATKATYGMISAMDLFDDD